MVRLIRKLGVLLLFALFLQSCSTTLQSSWRDFNAYFNTYYNAKTSFERGLETQERQDIEINPERPIRVHATPRRAGQSDFAHAAEKSADVIRFHGQSRWVDDAIMLIGMSYFYQQQYFSADQKFVELLATTTDQEMRQNAILWRGKAALEMENFSEGINYVQSRLFSTEFDWDPEIEAEVKLVIAQLYVGREEYEDAVVYLAEALPDIGDRYMRMRAHFLHGQLLEILGHYEEAFAAYEEATHRSNPNYDLIYHAERKMGVVARKQGNHEWAYDHFSSMSRDDRHFEYLSEIQYERARTLQDMGRFTEAYQRYEDILRHRSINPTREDEARIFYGMAEIHRDHYLDYTLTAAYFDSSSQQSTNRELLPKNFDADIMARSYGEYSRLNQEIHHLDSLLWLGTLSPADRDSVIEEVRARKIAEMEAQARDQQRQQMISVDDIDEAGVQADEETENGFLNHQNPQLMQQMGQAFQAYWGQRPLVDDWRRMEMVRINIVRQFEDQGEEVDDVDSAIQELADEQAPTVDIDLAEIPLTEEEQRETRHSIASREYEIGNVFFNNLAMPDSAARYFRNVMGRFPDSELAPQAIYSLSELYDSSGDSVQAMQYAMQLVDFYPNTIYAERMADRYMLERQVSEKVLSREDSLSRAFEEILSHHISEGRAGKLRNFAEKHPEHDKAPEALYRSLQDYAMLARDDDQYHLRLNDLSFTRHIWNQEQNEREAFKDSVRAMMADSVFMAVIHPEYEEIHGTDDGDDAVPGESQGRSGADENGFETGTASDPDQQQESISDNIEGDSVDEMRNGRETDTPETEEQEAEDQEAEDQEAAPQESDTEERPARKSITEHFQSILDYNIEEPDFKDLFPYEGALWDSARVVLFALKNDYPEFSGNRVVSALAEEIDADRVRADMVDTSRVHNCDELDGVPEIAGGEEQFLEASGLQELLDAQMIHRNVTIAVTIGRDGSPMEFSVISDGHAADYDDDYYGDYYGDYGYDDYDDEAYYDDYYDDYDDADFESNADTDIEAEADAAADTEAGADSDIMESLMQVIDTHLRFNPPTSYGVAVPARCEYELQLHHQQ